MAGIRVRVSKLIGWPAEQIRHMAGQVSARLEASREASRARLAQARAENATKVIEVSPPSSRAGTRESPPPKARE